MPIDILLHAKRFFRTRSAVLGALAWLALALLVGFAARVRGTGQVSALSSTHASTALPFLAYVLVGGLVSKNGLRASVQGFTLLGMSARRAAGSFVLAAIVLGAVFGAISSVLVCAVGHAATDPPLGAAMPVAAWVGALGGATYGVFFLLGSSFFSGTGRSIAFGIDWIFGGSSIFSLVMPHGHVESLFGGARAFHVSQRVSSVLLFVLMLLMGAWTLRRTSRAR